MDWMKISLMYLPFGHLPAIETVRNFLGLLRENLISPFLYITPKEELRVLSAKTEDAKRFVATAEKAVMERLVLEARTAMTAAEDRLRYLRVNALLPSKSGTRRELEQDVEELERRLRTVRQKIQELEVQVPDATPWLVEGAFYWAKSVEALSRQDYRIAYRAARRALVEYRRALGHLERPGAASPPQVLENLRAACATLEGMAAAFQFVLEAVEQPRQADDDGSAH